LRPVLPLHVLKDHDRRLRRGMRDVRHRLRDRPCQLLLLRVRSPRKHLDPHNRHQSPPRVATSFGHLYIKVSRRNLGRPALAAAAQRPATSNQSPDLYTPAATVLASPQWASIRPSPPSTPRSRPGAKAAATSPVSMKWAAAHSLAPSSPALSSSIRRIRES